MVVDRAGNAIGAFHDHHRVAIGPFDEVAVGIGCQQRHVVDVGICQVDAEHIAGLGLDHLPGRHATDLGVVGSSVPAIGTQIAVGDQLACGNRAFGSQHIAAQEHLVRGVRAVGLVLVYERRGGVGVLANVVRGAKHAIGAGLVGGAGDHHEVGETALHIQRVIRLQGDVDGTRAALADQVQAMVEELPEEGHPGVERC